MLLVAQTRPLPPPPRPEGQIKQQRQRQARLGAILGVAVVQEQLEEAVRLADCSQDSEWI